MKIEIESTTKIVTLVIDGKNVPARVWQGETESGIPVQCFITRIAPEIPQSDRRIDELTAEFERDLKRQADHGEEIAALILRLSSSQRAPDGDVAGLCRELNGAFSEGEKMNVRVKAAEALTRLAQQVAEADELLEDQRRRTQEAFASRDAQMAIASEAITKYREADATLTVAKAEAERYYDALTCMMAAFDTGQPTGERSAIGVARKALSQSPTPRAEAVREADSERQFPIMHGGLLKSIPWSFIAPHERQAIRNHGQTLERLAERGGLSPCEALAVLRGEPWPWKYDNAASEQLTAMLAAHHAAGEE